MNQSACWDLASQRVRDAQRAHVVHVHAAPAADVRVHDQPWDRWDRWDQQDEEREEAEEDDGGPERAGGVGLYHNKTQHLIHNNKKVRNINKIYRGTVLYCNTVPR